MNDNFKYSCIGDNTPENREWLEKIGYKDISRHSTGKYIETTNSGGYSIFSNDLVLYISNKNYTGNPQLFRAVTAIREDSDYMQWFTDGKSWLNVPIGYDLAGFLYADWDGECGIEDINKYHKASLEELINHFK